MAQAPQRGKRQPKKQPPEPSAKDLALDTDLDSGQPESHGEVQMAETKRRAHMDRPPAGGELTSSPLPLRPAVLRHRGTWE